MANPADHYDPTMFLDQGKNMLSPDATNTTPGDNHQPGPANVGRFDGTANTGTQTGEPLPLRTFATPGENTPRWPAGVDNFDPLNLPAPQRFGPLAENPSNPTKGSAGRP